MRSGKLRELAIIEHDTGTSQTGYGAQTENWEEFGRAMVAIEELMGREFLLATQVVEGKPIRVRMRYVEGLNAKMRLRVGERMFQITTVQAMDRKRHEQSLLCREVT